jgi:hypothetical protein
MQPLAIRNPPSVGRGRCSNRARGKTIKTIGSVTRAAAAGSFQAVGVNGTPSKDTRIVAGRLKEKTIEARRSAWDLLRMFSERKKAPVRKIRMKAMRGGGMEGESSRKRGVGPVGKPSGFAHTSKLGGIISTTRGIWRNR